MVDPTGSAEGKIQDPEAVGANRGRSWAAGADDPTALPLQAGCLADGSPHARKRGEVAAGGERSGVCMMQYVPCASICL